jgi:hypothetical protein
MLGAYPVESPCEGESHSHHLLGIDEDAEKVVAFVFVAPALKSPNEYEYNLWA